MATSLLREATINGQTLGHGQAMAFRVAVTGFLADLARNPDLLGNDSLGRRITHGYQDRLSDVVGLLLAPSTVVPA